MNRIAALGALALLSAPPALALETPKPCSATEPRVRCVAYKPAEVVQLYAAPGASLTVEFGEGEEITDASVSDNGLLDGAGDASPRAFLPIGAGQQGGAPGTADRNLSMAKRGGFLFLKPLRSLVPQPVTVLTRTAEGKVRRYTFQLETRPGPVTVDADNTFYAVRFTYPEDADRARRERWAAMREAREARAAAARLRANNISGESVKNKEYWGEGAEEDKAALAPSSGSTEPNMWDDGQRTFLRYAGNRRVPMVYQILPDGREGVVGQSTEADPTTRGSLLVLHGVFKGLKLRDGKAVLCIVNRGWDGGTGRNPGTGTTNPDVIREATDPQEKPARAR